MCLDSSNVFLCGLGHFLWNFKVFKISLISYINTVEIVIFSHFVSAITLEPLHLQRWNFACAPIFIFSEENFFFEKKFFAKKNFFSKNFFKKKFFFIIFFKWFQEWLHQILGRSFKKHRRYSQKTEKRRWPPSWIKKKPQGGKWRKVAIPFLGTLRYL